MSGRRLGVVCKKKRRGEERRGEERREREGKRGKERGRGIGTEG